MNVDFGFLMFFGLVVKVLLVVGLEVKGVVVGSVLCFVGVVLFVHGTTDVTFLNAVSNMFLSVIGMFLMLAGLLVLIVNLFGKGSIFTWVLF
ncbi:MAG: hypothetical protein ACUVT5_02170 [Candidatus Bathyarchaeales archaeon]